MSYHDVCHDWWWCTFFKPVYFLAKRTRNVGLFWPLLATFSYFVANLLVLVLSSSIKSSRMNNSTGSNNHLRSIDLLKSTRNSQIQPKIARNCQK